MDDQLRRSLTPDDGTKDQPQCPKRQTKKKGTLRSESVPYELRSTRPSEKPQPSGPVNDVEDDQSEAEEMEIPSLLRISPSALAATTEDHHRMVNPDESESSTMYGRGKEVSRRGRPDRVQRHSPATESIGGRPENSRWTEREMDAPGLSRVDEANSTLKNSSGIHSKHEDHRREIDRLTEEI